jgi:acyl-CoA dehydrogenase
MDFAFSEKVRDLQRRLQSFMDEHIYPNEQRFHDQVERNRWSPTRLIEESTPLRTRKLPPSGKGTNAVGKCAVFLRNAMDRIEVSARLKYGSARDDALRARYSRPASK